MFPLEIQAQRFDARLEQRLVAAFDDPALVSFNAISVGPDELYLTVAQYESDIWVANLRW
ncbi:MAG: hypothetical protein AAB409_06595 [Gemmatimonadota bacterium]